MGYITMKQRIAILVIIISVTVTGATWASDSSKDSTKSDYVLANGVTAIDRALEYTGFEKLEGYSKSNGTKSDLVTISDDKTPFIAEKINGREVLMVLFKNVKVDIGNHMVHRDFKVLIDPSNGQMLHIISVSNEVGSSDTLPQPSAEKAREYLEGRGIRFHGLPEEAPPVSLADALSACFKNPATTKVIKGMYMDISVSNTRYPKLWIIILRGTETPMLSAGLDPDRVPVYLRNSLLFAVDAITGKWVFTMEAPRDLESIKVRKTNK